MTVSSSSTCRRGPHPRTEAVLLDALGTLVELPPPAPALCEELRERFALDIDEPAVAAALRAEITFYRVHFDEGRDAPSVSRLRHRCAEVLRDALPLSGELDLGELTAALLGALRFRAYPDAAPALDSLRRRGLPVVVASNWDVSLPETLARVGLLERLDGVVTSASVGERKPSARLFTRALAVAGHPDPGRVTHVGDTVGEDVEGALRAGLRPILIRRDGGSAADGPGGSSGSESSGGGAPAGVQVITSLSELGPLL